jgi:NAD(P)-dependent dehydrogenase (short-subunit alcohol dehydrogenase family)
MSQAVTAHQPIVVLGGTRGLGRTVSVQLATAGRDVVCIGRTPSPVHDAAPDGRVHVLGCDFEDLDRLREVLVSIRSSGAIGGLVLSQRYRGTADAWAGELHASLHVSRTALETLDGAFATGGAVVAVSSLASRRIMPDCSPGYHAAKAALEQLVRYYAVKWGPGGVRVNGVSPGVFVKQESAAYYAERPALSRYYEALTPLGRMGRAEETANVIRFLLGPDASFITGQVITVDGGMSLQDADTVARALGVDRERR